MWNEGESVTMTLPVKLTEEELVQRRDRMASLVLDVEVAEAEKKAAAKQAKAEIDEMKGDISDIARWIRDGKEPRPIKCTAEADFLHRKMILVRSDTGEVIDSRPLTEAEMQRVLPLGDTQQ